MTGRIPARALRLAAAGFGAAAMLAMSAGAASANETLYSNQPGKPKPGNINSQPFEASSTSEAGGQVELAGGARIGQSIQIGMSSWACETGSWNGPSECVTTKGAKFEVPLTVNLYNVGPANAVGSLITSVTQTVRIPYRPSQNNKKCTGEDAGAWYDMSSKTCFHGKFAKVTVKLGKVALPAQVIVTVAYNTSDYGAVPQRPQPCNSTSAGCPYDSLNVALAEPGTEMATPSVGSDPAPADGYLSSTWGGAYCDGGLSGTGSLRLDSGCWLGFQPLLAIKGM
jgi:hypothetical protein